MYRETTSKNDENIFTRTAQKTKAINIYPTNQRGGIRF